MEDNKCLSKTGKTEPNRLFSLTATSTTTAPTSTAGRNQVFSLECCLRDHPCTTTSENDWVGGWLGLENDHFADVYQYLKLGLSEKHTKF